MLESNLAKLGFSKNEITVYLSLFKLGRTRAGAIIEDIKLHRNLVYTALEHLVEKGLVSKILHNGIAVFEANSPHALVSLIENQKTIAEEVLDELHARQEETSRDLTVWEGIEGVKRVRTRTLTHAKKGDTLYVIGASAEALYPALEPFWKKFNRTMMQKGVHTKILYDQGDESNVVVSHDLSPPEHARLLPFGLPAPLSVAFHQDMLDITVGSSDVVTFSIRNKEAVEGFRRYFDYFWNQEVRVESGTEALRKAMYEMLEQLKPEESYEVLGALTADKNPLIQKLYIQFHKDRIKKGVITNMLVYKNSYEEMKKRFRMCGDLVGRISHVKSFVSAPLIPMQINLYKEKTFIILYDNSPTIIHFNRREIFDGFKTYFDVLWKSQPITM